MTVGSLCAGIGGFDLGFERAGMTVRWQVEIDPFCRKVLTKHWPNVKRYEDLTTLTGDELEPVDLVCAGFPCQPVSVAGARKGQADERWIWPHIARLLGVLRPRWVVLENTPGLFTAGSRFIESPESTFGAVLGDLAALGFDCEYETVSAQDLGAPHLRKRVWIVAHARHSGVLQRRLSGDVEEQGVFAGGVLCDGVQSGEGEQRESVADADGGRRDRIGQPQQRPLQSASGDQSDRRRTHGRFFDAEIGGEWEVEPNIRRISHGVPNRVDRLKGLGNAIVPQIAEWIGRRIIEVER